MSAEINSIYQTAFMGFLGGSVYGGFLKSRLAYLEFMENNQATSFKSHFDAKVCYWTLSISTILNESSS